MITIAGGILLAAFILVWFLGACAAACDEGSVGPLFGFFLCIGVGYAFFG